MEKEFVSYEQAVALKELGFDEKCLTTYIYKGGLNSIWNVLSYQIENEYLFENTCDDLWDTNSTNKNDCISAPLKQQVFGWFREKYEYIPHIYIYENLNLYDFDIYGGLADKYDEYELGNQLYNTYEEAENACIDKLIELAKQQDNDNRNQV
jgi:hypothetical protein